MDPHNVFLDEPDPELARAAAGYDYVVLNGAKWFTRPVVLHEGGAVLGCSGGGCGGHPNATYVPPERNAPCGPRSGPRSRRCAGSGAGWSCGRLCRRTTRTASGTTAGTASGRGGGASGDGSRVPRRAGRSVPRCRGGRGRPGPVRAAGRQRHDADEGGLAPGPVRALAEKVGFGIDCVHWCLPGSTDAWSELLLHLLTR
ncbi:unnamed protein product [Urochloa humidicola]